MIPVPFFLWLVAKKLWFLQIFTQYFCQETNWLIVLHLKGCKVMITFQFDKFDLHYMKKYAYNRSFFSGGSFIIKYFKFAFKIGKKCLFWPAPRRYKMYTKIVSVTCSYLHFCLTYKIGFGTNGIRKRGTNFTVIFLRLSEHKLTKFLYQRNEFN